MTPSSLKICFSVDSVNQMFKEEMVREESFANIYILVCYLEEAMLLGIVCLVNCDNEITDSTFNFFITEQSKKFLILSSVLSSQVTYAV